MFGELSLLLRLLLAVFLLSHRFFGLLLLHFTLWFVLISDTLEQCRRKSLKEGVILHAHLNLLFGWQILDNWGDLESTGFVIRHKDLEDKVFVGVVLDQSGSLHDLSDL